MKIITGRRKSISILSLVVIAIALTTLFPRINFRMDPSTSQDVLIKMKYDEDSTLTQNNAKQEPPFLTLREYTIPGCSCVRFGFSVESITKAQQEAKKRPWLFPASFLERYDFEGQSTCSDYSTQRGTGQKVVSYSCYTPGGKVDPESQHFQKYLGLVNETAGTINSSYPGWNIRIYHSITEDDDEGNHFLCRIFCDHQHVDLCPVHNLPGFGNLKEHDVVGRVWRFAVMGDPTVSKFLVRDTDSWVLDREVAVVNEWLGSDKGFHVIRDHPQHKHIMLAGLWGGTNKNLEFVKKLRDEMFSQPLNLNKGFDQYLLRTLVWPKIKDDVMQHDSYTCLEKDHEGSLPFPVQRVDNLYCGSGPFKEIKRGILLRTICPKNCRPELHGNWTFC